MENLGRFVALTIKNILQNKAKFSATVFLLWIGLVSNVNIPDQMAQDAFFLLVLYGMMALIFSSMLFRVFLVTRGSLRIIGKTIKLG